MAALDYELSIEEREGYLYACVEADVVSFEMVIEYTNEIIAQLRRGGYSCLLLQSDTPVLNSTDCYLIASYIVRNSFSRKIRIAVLDKTPGHQPKQQEISRASRTAGIDLRSFQTKNTAEAWLLEKSNGQPMGVH